MSSVTLHALANEPAVFWRQFEVAFGSKRISRCDRRVGDVENQKVAGGVLITLDKPSKQMRTEAADASRYTSKLWHDKDYPSIQILTVEGLFDGTERIDAPPQVNPFAMAARETAREKRTEML